MFEVNFASNRYEGKGSVASKSVFVNNYEVSSQKARGEYVINPLQAIGVV